VLQFHSEFLERLSGSVNKVTSSSFGFAMALALVLLWLISGPSCHYSQTWQLFINTVTTTVTFLMVFLIQRAESKETQALHIKLNRILEKLNVENAVLGVEDLPEAELDALTEKDRKLASGETKKPKKVA
jgi:low affinity Fe/Cu permease